jgi:hypothetical protein
VAREEDHRPTISANGSLELQIEAPSGVLELMELYETLEETYVRATIASSTAEVQMLTGNSTNFPLQRGS